MMQLLCSGVFLDLKEGTTMAFKKVNPLFAFDSISCERTTEFSLPDTPKNNRVLGLAKHPAFYGGGMRTKFPAQLSDGACVKDGYLYVSKYAGGEYKAIFVTGDLIGLQSIKDAGKLSNIIAPTDSIAWDTNSYDRAANASNLPNLALISYYSEKAVGWHKDEQVHPSVSLSYLLTSALSELGVSASIPTEAQGLRVVIGDLKGGSGSCTFTQTLADSSQPHTSRPTSVYNGTSVDNLGAFISYATNEYASYRVVDTGYTTYYYRLRQFVAQSPLKLSFPSNTSSDLFLVSFNGNTFNFLGDYSFQKSDDDVTTSGSPLGGRTVDIPIGTKFLFVTPYDYVSTSDTLGWRFADIRKTVKAEVTTEVEDGAVVRLVDNLPDVTAVELLKTVSALSGKVLNYTDAEGVSFDSLDFSTWHNYGLDGKVISEKELSRTFADYVKENIIDFKSDDSVLESERASSSYIVPNDTLEAEKVLQTIPLSEGGEMRYDDTQSFLYIRNGGEAKFKDTICRCGSMTELMRCNTVINSGLQTLCTESTKLVVTARLSLYEFNSIGNKTAILYNGTRYVWTDANWSQNVATITLAKV